MNSTFTYKKELNSEPPENEITAFILENGLKVIFLKNHAVPVVAVDLWYQVGSRNEEPGKSGFAHLFEHMMFEGSANVKKAEHMRLINDVGGVVNGSTSQDRTNYWQVVPANQLELALWLEADRMRSLNLSQETFENQRDTVKEERRMRVDNQPYMRILYEMKDELAYRSFPYRHSVIGSMADLDNAGLQDVRDFHDKYYRPNNAILAVAGDFLLADALSLVKKHFESIPAGAVPEPVNIDETLQGEEKRIVYEDPFAPFPAYVCSWHVPGRGEPDFYALELLEKILFDGDSSRLHRRLIEEEQFILHLMGGSDGKMGPALFFMFAQIRPSHTIAEVEAVVDEEIRKLVEEEVSERELLKAKNKLRSDHVSLWESSRSRADQLCLYTMLFDNPLMFRDEPKVFGGITAADLKRTARKYFRKENRSVIEVYPKPPQA
ncbi:MAG: pitrilysin family protein [Calditrichia bacterium]